MSRCSKFVFLAASAFWGNNTSYAASTDSFGVSAMVGEYWGPGNYRLSIGHFDLTHNICFICVGSRAWMHDYYAGLGIGYAVTGSLAYGLVGYEWRFWRYTGLLFEFDGMAGFNGSMVSIGYVGLNVGI